MVHAAGDEQDCAFDEGCRARGVHAREDDDFQGSLQVFQRGDRHRLAVAGGHESQPGDDAAHYDPLAVERFVLEVRRIGRDVLPELLGDGAQRVLG